MCAWKNSLLDTNFNQHDAQRIKTLRLLHTTSNDKLIWKFSHSWKYTVRSSYHNIMENIVNNDYLKAVGDWMIISKLGVPHKIKHFLWRLLRAFSTKMAEEVTSVWGWTRVTFQISTKPTTDLKCWTVYCCPAWLGHESKFFLMIPVRGKRKKREEGRENLEKRMTISRGFSRHKLLDIFAKHFLMVFNLLKMSFIKLLIKITPDYLMSYPVRHLHLLTTPNINKNEC